MHFRSSLLPLWCLLLLWPAGAFAQAPPWPRDARTGRTVFAGLLLWPTPTLTRSQQQALVRRWYRAKLTSQTPAYLAEYARHGATFAGLPAWTHLDSVAYWPTASAVVDSFYDKITWRLAYEVQLVATPVGLAYRLSEVKLAEMVYDTGYDWPVETAPPRLLTQQAALYRRLRRALASW